MSPDTNRHQFVVEAFARTSEPGLNRGHAVKAPAVVIFINTSQLLAC